MPKSCMVSRKPSGTVPRSSPITMHLWAALSARHRQQRLERHLHIGAVVGLEAARHQIQPLQAQHVIEPDGAGMAHRGREHIANGTKDCASRPPALKPARPQSWPTVLSTSGGAPTAR